jgi:hypothetical protein
MASLLTIERLADGRVLGSVGIVPLGIVPGQVRAQETPVVSIARADWRGCLDIFVNPNGNTFVDSALVRVYAVMKTGRVEVARGRVGINTSNREVVRLRGQGCDSYDVTLTADYINIDSPINPTNAVSVSFCAWSTIGTADTDPVTRKHTSSGFFGEQLAKTPARLFSANASNRSATDLWLMMFDSYVPAADGTIPNLPSLYLPANGKGVGAIAFDRRPFESIAGLYWAVSTSPATLITPGGFDWPIAEFEFL